MMVCEICGKGKSVGRSKTHKRGVAGKRWRKRVTPTRRLFKPNLQMKTVVFADGTKKKMKLCAKCIKRIKKFGSVNKYRSVSFV